MYFKKPTKKELQEDVNFMSIFIIMLEKIIIQLIAMQLHTQ